MDAYTNLPNTDENSHSPVCPEEQIPMNISVEVTDPVDSVDSVDPVDSVDWVDSVVDTEIYDSVDITRRYNRRYIFIECIRWMAALCLAYLIIIIIIVVYLLISMKLESERYIATDGSGDHFLETTPYVGREPSTRLGASLSNGLPLAVISGAFRCKGCIEKDTTYTHEESDENAPSTMNFIAMWMLCCIFIRLMCYPSRRS